MPGASKPRSTKAPESRTPQWMLRELPRWMLNCEACFNDCDCCDHDPDCPYKDGSSPYGETEVSPEPPVFTEEDYKRLGTTLPVKYP